MARPHALKVDLSPREAAILGRIARSRKSAASLVERARLVLLASEGMKTKDIAVELGVEMLTDGPWGALQLSAFHDVSGTHEGFELYANYSYGWRDQRLYIEPSIGASYKSADLNNYYWGVTNDEAGVVVAPYEAEAGLNWQARLMVGYQLSRHWGLTLVAEDEHINDEAAASPILKERGVLGYFGGLVYRF